MKTNLAAEEKLLYSLMLKNIKEEDSTPMLFMITKDGVEFDNIDKFDLPSDVEPYRAKAYEFSTTWVNKDKSKWVICRKAEYFRYNPSFLKFMVGMVYRLKFDFSRHLPLVFHTMEDITIRGLERPSFQRHLVRVDKTRFETSAAAFYGICDMPIINFLTGSIVKPATVTFNGDYTFASYYYSNERHYMKYDCSILEDDCLSSCITAEL